MKIKEQKQKVLNSLTLVSHPQPSNDVQLRYISLSDPRLQSFVCERIACTCVCCSNDPSGTMSTTSQPTAQHPIGLCTLTEAPDWITHKEAVWTGSENRKAPM